MDDALMFRFIDKILVMPNDCWEWTATILADTGYGQIGVAGKRRKAHRVAYELFVGPIPEGMQLDHLCRNRSCVNPSHLEPVTNRENALRGVGICAQNAAKTHCKHGHEFTPENTYQPPSGWRACRICRRANRRRRTLASRSGMEVITGVRQRGAESALRKPAAVVLAQPID